MAKRIEDWVRNAEIERVVDADTFIIKVDLGFNISTRIAARVLDYDAPETRRGKKVTAKHKEHGLEAKWVAESLFDDYDSGNPSVIIRSHSTGKYGRYLVDISFYRNKKLIDYATHMKSLGFEKKIAY